VLGKEVKMGVVEVIGCVSKGVDFELSEEILGEFLQEPVDDHSAFDTALAVEDKDDFGEFRFVESSFDDFVTVADVLGSIVEVSLN
jgi:hypothetical protein